MRIMKKFVFYLHWKKFSKNLIFTVQMILHVNYNSTFPTQDTISYHYEYLFMHAQEFFRRTSSAKFHLLTALWIVQTVILIIFRLYNDMISEKYWKSSSFSTKIEANGAENIIVKNLSSDFV